MNYHLHENGWTVILDDFDFKTASQEDINHISRLLATNTLVVVKKQTLTVEDELRVINMFKNPQPLFTKEDADFKNCAVDSDGIICRVTAELNDQGEPGLAAHEDALDWHCNHPWKKDRAPIVWLFGVKGTAGSKTTWNNTILAYNDLSEEDKEFYKSIKIMSKGGMDWGAETEQGFVTDDYNPSLVCTNNAGKTGLFFPFLQLHRFVGMSREECTAFISKLSEYVIQDKYCYDHYWDDGDVVIAEQWLGIHKRWPFKDIDKRVLHRAVFDFPDQDYTGN